MEKRYVLTPWEVKGKIDYKKLIEEFGVKEIDDELLTKIKKIAGNLHILLKRRFFYAHRDLDIVIDEYEKGKKFFLYTGVAPSRSTMHMGHIIPFILTKWLQESFGANTYIMVPDDEKYWAKKGDLKSIREFAIKNIKHVIALGFDPDKTFIFLNTEYIKHLYEIALPIARYINLSIAKATFGFSGETSVGLIFYPALQIAPTFFEENRCLIPCGIDQDPYFRLQRDIAEKFGKNKAAEILSKFLWGLQGPDSKMSASKPETAIFLDDDPEIAKKKVMDAFTGGRATIKEQREKGGNPDICCVYQLYYILFEEDEKKLKERYTMCKLGNLICGDCKKELAERVARFLKDHQRKLKEAEKKIDKFMYNGKLAQEMWNKRFKIV